MNGVHGASKLRYARIAMAALAIALIAWPGGRNRLGQSQSIPGTFADKKFGWTLQAPPGFQLGTLSSGGLDGVWVANFDAAVTETCCPIPNISSFRRFPVAGAAFMLWIGQGFGPVARPPMQDSTLPLSVDRFRPIPPYVGGAEPAPLFLSFAANGIYYAAAAWFGPEASAEDRRAIADTISSIRFPHLHAGEWSDEGQYWVLGKTNAYPVGSITPFVVPASSRHPRSVAYYLARADAGFFIVQRRYFEGSLSCEIALQRDGYVCPDPPLTWNAEGNLLSGTGTPNAEDMACSRPTTAFDGTLLFWPFYGPPSYVGRGRCSS